MRPVIQRIADCLSETFRPLQKLLLIRSIPGNILLLYTAGAHVAPLIVISAQPDLSDVFKLSVLSNLSGINVAVIVKNGHFCRIFMIQLLCHLCLKDKILIHESLHFVCLLFLFYLGL